jgi:hypothetical protein
MDIRATVLQQVRYLLDEIEMLRPMVRSVPEELLEARPLAGSLTLKELYGRLVEISDVEAPDFLASGSLVRRSAAPYETDWNQIDVSRILEMLRKARTEILDALETQPDAAWSESGIATAVAQHLIATDLKVQREIATRLSERPVSRA